MLVKMNSLRVWQDRANVVADYVSSVSVCAALVLPEHVNHVKVLCAVTLLGHVGALWFTDLLIERRR